MERPTIGTQRLILRPFSLADAPAVLKMASEKDVARNTLNIPHPYEPGMAEEWIGTHQKRAEVGELIALAIVLKETSNLIGAIGLTTDLTHRHAELGYWIGKPYWNKGYATEAGKALVAYAFGTLDLNRVHASHFKRNPASGRVLAKIGMTYEGCLRQQVIKAGEFQDLETYGVLRSECGSLREYPD